jgi:hypothetical protein
VTPEEIAVIKAADTLVRWHKLDDVGVGRDLILAVQRLTFNCHECNTNTHRCPGDGNPIPHGAHNCGEHDEAPWPNRERDEQTAPKLAAAVLETAQEWMRVHWLGGDQDDSVRVNWQDSPQGLLHLGRERYSADLGRYHVSVQVQALPPLPPHGPETDPALIEEMKPPVRWDEDNPGCAPEACGGSRLDPCSTVLRTQGAQHDDDVPNEATAWVDGCTWFDLRPGDTFRWRGNEGEIETISIGDWHMRVGDRSWDFNGSTYYNDKPWEHREVHVRIVGREGRMQIMQPNEELSILMTGERLAVHHLHRAKLKPEVP